MTKPNWKNEKTKCIVSWIVNTPEIYISARNFATSNPNVPILYRAWIKAEGLQEFETSEGISVLDPELHFGELSEVLWSLTI